MPTTPLPMPSTSSGPTPNKLVNPTSTPDQPPTLPLVLARLTLHDVSTSSEYRHNTDI